MLFAHIDALRAQPCFERCRITIIPEANYGDQAQTDLSDYKTLYLQTAKEYADKMSASCIELSIDISNKEALNNLHIASHSLKSQSQVMQYNDVANICLSIENTSDNALKGNSKLTNDNIASIKSSVGQIKEMLEKV